MLFPFRLISASLRHFSRDITNDMILKQNIFDLMYFLSNSEFQEIPLKKATTEITCEIIALNSSISPYISQLMLDSLYIYIYTYIYVCIYIYIFFFFHHIN